MEPSGSAKPMDRGDVPTRGEPRAARTPRAVFSTAEGTGTAIEETAYDMNRSRLIEEAIMVFLGPDKREVHDSASHGLRPDYDWTMAEGVCAKGARPASDACDAWERVTGSLIEEGI